MFNYQRTKDLSLFFNLTNINMFYLPYKCVLNINLCFVGYIGFRIQVND